jgi:predicted alternative tryptophan synthase beta-subunit
MPQTKFLLEESDIPTHWYNVVADMPNPPLPPLGPDGKPLPPEALAAKKRGEPRTILFNLSGHGHFDMAAYDRYFAGGLEDYDYPAAAIARSMKNLPKVSAA